MWKRGFIKKSNNESIGISGDDIDKYKDLRQECIKYLEESYVNENEFDHKGYYGLLYKLYKVKWKGFATVATIISLFVPILQPIFIFFLRNL